MKNLYFILGILLSVTACKTTDTNNTTVTAYTETSETKETANIQDKTSPLRIIPKVKIKNSAYNREKNLFAVREASEICKLVSEKKYEAVSPVQMSALKEKEAQKLTAAMEEYKPILPENYQLVVDDIFKTDYNNNGFEDILVRFAVTYLQPTTDNEGNENFTPYNYKYFTVLKRGVLTDLPKGDTKPFYYQDNNDSSQMFITVDGKRYMATTNHSGRIVRIDDIATSKNDIINHPFCEFGGQR